VIWHDTEEEKETRGGGGMEPQRLNGEGGKGFFFPVGGVFSGWQIVTRRGGPAQRKKKVFFLVKGEKEKQLFRKLKSRNKERKKGGGGFSRRKEAVSQGGREKNSRKYHSTWKVVRDETIKKRRGFAQGKKKRKNTNRLQIKRGALGVGKRRVLGICAVLT